MSSDDVVGSYLTLKRGTTYKGALVGEPGPALLGLGSIVPGGGFRNDYKTYGGECPPELTLTAGDLYVSLKGATKDGEMIGSIARVPDHVPLGRLTQDTVGLQLREEDPEIAHYLYWLLRTPQYRRYCADRATGSAVVALSRDDFLTYPVPAITASRRKVVAILEDIELKVASNDRTSRLDIDIALARLAEGDRKIRVGDIADFVKGLSYKGAGLSDSSDASARSMINLANFTTTGRPKYSGLKFYTGDFKSKHEVRAWDLVVANTDLTQEREILGRGFLVPESMDGAIHTHHTSVVRFRERPELAIVLWAQLQTDAFRARAKGFATGTTVTALPPEAVLDFEMGVPAPLDDALKIVRTFVEHSWYLEVESTQLRRLRDSLLAELGSEQLDDADRAHL